MQHRRSGVTPMGTVARGFFDVLRSMDVRTVFSNPGSTEIPLMSRWPSDIEFVLCLHEASAVGAAAGWALGSGRVGVAIVHTTAGYGNAIGAVATARTNRIPLVLVVGQQDRRHLANTPFLAGELEGLAGTYPVFVATPTRAADVPGLIARARHEAVVSRGPAVVIVPMDDWDAPYHSQDRWAAPRELWIAAGLDDDRCASVAQRLHGAHSPVIVTGAGGDSSLVWQAVEDLASALDCPVWQEPFGAQAGSAQDSARFEGHLPAGRSALREALAGHDVILVIGTAALRQYGYEEGPLFAPEADVVVITDDREQATGSAADVAVLTPLPAFCARLADLLTQRRPATTGAGGAAVPARSTSPDPEPGGDGPLLVTEVFEVLGARLDADTVLLEESPSSRLQLQHAVPARRPLGFLSAAMGGLGFAMPAAVGLRIALPDRPVVAVIGDGSALYSCQALWTAQKYGVGVLFVILSNGGYAIMDRLTIAAGATPPWPSFDDIDVGRLAESFGCRARRVSTQDSLLEVLDEVVPSLRTSGVPLLLNVIVERTATVAPRRLTEQN